MHGPTAVPGPQIFSPLGVAAGAGLEPRNLSAAGTSFAKAGRVPGGWSKGWTSAGAATCAPVRVCTGAV